MKKFINNLITAVSIIMLGWIILSFVEINVKNVNPNPTYSKFNIIVEFVSSVQKNCGK